MYLANMMNSDTLFALDSLVIAGRAGRAFTAVPIGAGVSFRNFLGYPFLSQLGVVGFNHRTHQLILYR
jgi:hypothetical protein